MCYWEIYSVKSQNISQTAGEVCSFWSFLPHYHYPQEISTYYFLLAIFGSGEIQFFAFIEVTDQNTFLIGTLETFPVDFEAWQLDFSLLSLSHGNHDTSGCVGFQDVSNFACSLAKGPLEGGKKRFVCHGEQLQKGVREKAIFAGQMHFTPLELLDSIRAIMIHPSSLTLCFRNISLDSSFVARALCVLLNSLLTPRQWLLLFFIPATLRLPRIWVLHSSPTGMVSFPFITSNITYCLYRSFYAVFAAEIYSESYIVNIFAEFCNALLRKECSSYSPKLLWEKCSPVFCETSKDKGLFMVEVFFYFFFSFFPSA